MSSNFVKLFAWYARLTLTLTLTRTPTPTPTLTLTLTLTRYARSHFYCGLDLLFMTLNYYAFTSSGGRHFTTAFSFAPLLANTWPVTLTP